MQAGVPVLAGLSSILIHKQLLENISITGCIGSKIVAALGLSIKGLSFLHVQQLQCPANMKTKRLLTLLILWIARM